MPKVDIELYGPTTTEKRLAISDAIQVAMERALGTLPAGRLHTFTEIGKEMLIRHEAAFPKGERGIFLTFYLAPRPKEAIAAMVREVLVELGEHANLGHEEVSLLVVDVPSHQWWWSGKSVA